MIESWLIIYIKMDTKPFNMVDTKRQSRFLTEQ